MTSLEPFETTPDAAVGTEPDANAGGAADEPEEATAPVDAAVDTTEPETTAAESAPASGSSASDVASEPDAPSEEAPSAEAEVAAPESGGVAEAEAEAEGTLAEPAEVDEAEAAAPETAEVDVAQEEGGEVELSGDEELVAVDDVESGPTTISPFDRPGDWYVVHTYSGYENKVKNNLASRVRSMGVEERIHEVVIPMEDVIEFKGGRKTVVQKKVFPGYLLVRMDLDDNSWYVVRNTPGVTGFVGSGAKPTPLSRREVEDILGVEQLEGEKVEKKARPRLEFEVGDQVRVAQGNAFADFDGTIAEIDEDRARLKVLVNIFGRETPVELAFHEVSKV